jgi:aspartate 1-decarboxylase
MRRRRMLNSKIHRAVVTDADLDYVGSVSIDPELLSAANIIVNEQVTVLDINNGARFETYAIEGKPGEICLNGAAARLVQRDDIVILLTYVDVDEADVDGHVPTVVLMAENNKVDRVLPAGEMA